MKKRSLALLLSLMMLFSLLPVQAAAEAPPDTITVTISVENLTKSTEDGAPWSGSLLGDEPVSLVLSEGSSALDAVEAALADAEKAFIVNHGFISSIAGLASGDYAAGDYAGWIGAVNGGVPNVGLDYIALQDGDTVRMVYSDGSGSVSAYSLSWSSSNAANSGFGFSTGLLSYVSGDYSDTLYLTMPSGATSLTVTDIPDEDYTSVRIYPYDSASYAPVGSTVYNLNDEIPLDDSFNALLVVVDEWAADYTINLRTTDDIDLAALKTAASAQITGKNDYWSVLPIYALGGSYTSGQQQNYIDDTIARIPTLGVGSLALQCIALNAMGYDPAELTDALGTSLDAYALLAAKDFSNVSDSDMAYAIIALLHAGDTYADTITTLTGLLASHQQESGTWPDPWGYGYETDVTSAAVIALAMASSDTYTAELAEARDALLALRNTDGTFSGASGDVGNANSTAMAMIALASVGLYQEGEDNADGLMMFTTGNNSGFIYSGSWGNSYNELATQQALLALSAIDKYDTATPYLAFDFSAGEKRPAAATPVSGAVVQISVSPADSSVTVEKVISGDEGDTFEAQTASPAGYYDLVAGSYNYSVSKSGYVTKGGSFTVTDEQAAANSPVPITVTLIAVSGGDDDNYIYITVKTPDETLYSRNQMLLTADMTPLSALLNTGLDVTVDDDYVSGVEDYVESGEGANSGWLYKVNGDEGILESADSYMLEAGDELVWFYTTDYTKEKSSSSWSGNSDTEPSVKENADGSFTVSMQKNGRDTFVENGVVVELTANAGQIPAIVTEDGIDIIEKSVYRDGKLCFILQEGADIVLTEPSITFSDVPESSWYYNEVGFAAARQLVLGMSDDLFAPDAEVTREMAVTVLYRFQNSPDSDSAGFEDVPDSSWFASSVGWAYGAGIVRGNDTGFGTGESITRQELAVMLYRYASVLDLDTTPGNGLDSFPDSNNAADWATGALSWAVNNGLMNGRDDGTLDPTGTATRAELVTMLYRLTQIVVE